MPAAVRSFSATGVSLVAASAIALTPIAPPMPAVPTLARDVSLAASPFDIYGEIYEATLLSIDFLSQLPPPALPPGVTLESVLAGLINDPAGRLAQSAAAVRALGANLPALAASLGDDLAQYADFAIDQLAQGRFDVVVAAVIGAAQLIAYRLNEQVVPLATPLLGPALSELLSNTELGGLVTLAPIIFTGPAVNAVGFTAVVAQDVLDALVAGDPEEVVNAVIQGPGQVIRGALFGGFGGFAGEAPGLLGFPFGGFSNFPGPVYTALRFGQVAQALVTPPAAANATAATTANNQKMVAVDLPDPPAASVQTKTADTDEITNEKALVKPSLPLLRRGAKADAEPGNAAAVDKRPSQALRSAVDGVASGISRSITGLRERVKKLSGTATEKTPSADSEG
jgi:hypothetical protein